MATFQTYQNYANHGRTFNAYFLTFLSVFTSIMTGMFLYNVKVLDSNNAGWILTILIVVPILIFVANWNNYSLRIAFYKTWKDILQGRVDRKKLLKEFARTYRVKTWRKKVEHIEADGRWNFKANTPYIRSLTEERDSWVSLLYQECIDKVADIDKQIIAAKIEEVVEKVIDNDLAQNLIRPYLGTFNYLNNLLDYAFDDNAKIVVAFNNLPFSTIVGYVAVRYTVSYADINEKYQELFGSSSSLEKKDYNSAKAVHFTYSDNGWGGVFDIMPFEGGGYGAAIFNIVKSASYNGDNIIVEVYHDKISTCEVDNNDGYCVDTESGGAIVNSIDELNMRDLITNFSDRIPVYTMTFAKDNGHYVLTNVEKQ